VTVSCFTQVFKNIWTSDHVSNDTRKWIILLFYKVKDRSTRMRELQTDRQNNTVANSAIG